MVYRMLVPYLGQRSLLWLVFSPLLLFFSPCWAFRKEGGSNGISQPSFFFASSHTTKRSPIAYTRPPLLRLDTWDRKESPEPQKEKKRKKEIRKEEARDVLREDVCCGMAGGTCKTKSLDAPQSPSHSPSLSVTSSFFSSYSSLSLCFFISAYSIDIVHL